MAVALAIARVDAAQAEDVAQESFIAAYGHISQLRRPERFAGWLAAIVAQKGIDAVRRARREKDFLAESAFSMPGDAQWAPSANPGLSAEEAAIVREAVRRLPEKYRIVVIMRYVSGLSAAQIAAAIGERAGTVRVRLYRAAARLARELAAIAPEVTR